MTIPTTPQPPYPKFTPEVLTQPPDYGVLKQLKGTWGNYGAGKGSRVS